MYSLHDQISKQIYYHIIIILSNMTSDRNQKSSPEKEVLNTVWESLKGWITNISFKMEEFTVLPISRQTLSLDQTAGNHQSFYVSGTAIKSVSAFMGKINSLIWYTYRKNVEIAPKAYSDIGWGCLLRVAQMAFANMLLGYSQTHSDLNRVEIIKAFTQRRQAQYGIISFIEVGFELWNREVGDWYSMTEVAMILQTLHERSPLGGSEHLKVVVYNQTVSIDELLETLEKTIAGDSMSNDKKDRLSNLQQIPSSRNPADGKEMRHKEIFLMITTQLNDCQRIKNQKQLLRLMELPIFRSCLGGVPQKARFITGKFGDKLCYLDPHYAQQAITDTNLEQELDSFTCTKPRWMKCDELEPNITICFHLKDQQDVKMLMQAIDQNQQLQTSENLVNYCWSGKVERGPLYFSQELQPDFQLLDSGTFEVLS